MSGCIGGHRGSWAPVSSSNTPAGMQMSQWSSSSDGAPSATCQLPDAGRVPLRHERWDHLDRDHYAVGAPIVRSGIPTNFSVPAEIEPLRVRPQRSPLSTYKLGSGPYAWLRTTRRPHGRRDGAGGVRVVIRHAERGRGRLQDRIVEIRVDRRDLSGDVREGSGKNSLDQIDLRVALADRITRNRIGRIQVGRK